MKKSLLSLLSVCILAGCSQEATKSAETIESNENVEQENAIESVEDTNHSADDKKEITEPIDPVTVDIPMWDFQEDKEYQLKMKVGPVIREEGYGILPVKVDTEDNITSTFKRLFDIGVFTGEGISSEQGYDIRLIDAENMTVSHPAVLMQEGYTTHAVQTFLGHGFGNDNATFGVDQDPVTYFVAFDAPKTEEVHVLFSQVGMVQSVPVVDREDSGMAFYDDKQDEVAENVVPSVDNILERELLNEQYDLLEGHYESLQKRVEPIESYKENLETSLSRIDEIEYSTLILSSDVLFDFDSSDLSEEADTELQAAIDELESVEGGKLEIVGHTDRENTEAYNQTLSEKRANAVKERLASLTDLSKYDEVTTEGKSFNEPIADNESEEGRAQNRRVALQFTPPKEEIVIESTEERLPDPEGQVSRFPDSVKTSFGNVEMIELKQVDDLTVGRFKVFKTEETKLKYDALAHVAGVGARGWSSDDSIGYNQFSAYAPTMISNGQRYYPLDYYLTPLTGNYIDEKVEKAPEDKKFIVPLAERNMPQGTSTNGAYFYATVVWPTTNEEEVTIDLADTGVYQSSTERTEPWRITNVPIIKE
ncbi:OmpA family protein [Marinilactibacillus kalidii]|uniref:OmpA family protein n=1 Tax=Marinilactibacillus kalidii TaxID=2820274 RepID=UPI001ABE1BAF|nr:OmpA family protein [Marinilactibacillus kalidii]